MEIYMPEPKMMSSDCAKCHGKNVKKYLTVRSPYSTRPEVYPFCNKCFKTLDIKS